MEPIRTWPDTVPADGRTLGWSVLEWVTEMILQPDGPRAGETFRFTPEQVRIVLRWFEIDAQGSFTRRSGTVRRLKGWGKDPFLAVISLVELCGPCRFGGWNADGTPIAIPHPSPWVQIAAVSLTQTKNTMRLIPGMLSPRMRELYGLDVGKEIIYTQRGGVLEAVTSSPRALEGGRATFVVLNEALALDTPIPAPSGWTTMGALSAGDVIFGSDGSPTTVVNAYPVQHGRRCFEVTFSDGTSIVASDGHLWATKLASSAAKPRVRTTQEMADDGRRFMVPRQGPRRTPDVELSVDPYLLGVWLGDGSTGDANITVGDEDHDALVWELSKRGVATHDLARAQSRAVRIGFSNRAGFGGDMGTPLAKALRGLPCYRDKHIPDEYLSAGTEQRLELLRGLMDSDGCAASTCVFVGTEKLARGVLELVRGLGQIATSAFTADARSRQGGYYRVSFTPTGIMPFALPRKKAKVRQGVRDWVSIRAIREVESVPVRCIEVDAPDHLFQAGESGHVTHNTQHWLANNGGHDMAMTIDGNIGKSRGGGARAMQITNAPLPGEDSVAEQTWHAWQEVQEGRALDTGIYYDSIEAPASVDMRDSDSLREGIIAARGDADWLDVDWIISTIYKGTYPPWQSRRMFLNQLTTPDDALVPAADWDALQKEDALQPGDAVVLGFDGGRRDDATALVAIRISDRFVQPLGIWEAPQGPVGDDWEVDRGAVDGFVRHAVEIYDVQAFFADVALWEAYIDNWSELLRDSVLIKASTRSAVGRDMRGGLAELTQANERLVAAIADGRVHHAGTATQLGTTLRRHTLNARRRPNQWGISFGKDSRHSKSKVDAYAALMLAYLALWKLTESGKTRKQRTGVVW